MQIRWDNETVSDSRQKIFTLIFFLIVMYYLDKEANKHKKIEEINTFNQIQHLRSLNIIYVDGC